jgi:hypothetical protein
MNTEHSFVITAVYNPQHNTEIDPTYKRLCDERNKARDQKNRALKNLLEKPNIMPETAVALGNAQLRWKKADEAVKGYSFGLL